MTTTGNLPGDPGRPLAEPVASPPTDAPPLPDTTLAELRELAGRYPQPRSALLPMLHLVQSVQGCVTSRGIETCAELLGLSAAEVSGVATFYTMYKRRPMGTHHVGVCTNTLCAVMGGDEIFQRLCAHLDVGNDETSADGVVSLEHIECNAACDYAPVVTVNWELFDDQTPDSAVDLVDRLRRGEPVRATRGATITSWRDAERVLAGFEDGLADEGPAAGEASLAGLRIAAERGWSAPPFPDQDRTPPAEPVEAPSTGSGSGTETGSGSGSGPATADDPRAAADEADTARAETETEVAESPADVEGGGSEESDD